MITIFSRLLKEPLPPLIHESDLEVLHYLQNTSKTLSPTSLDNNYGYYRYFNRLCDCPEGGSSNPRLGFSGYFHSLE